ncbi:hypothetical protein [Flavobacterium psychrotrophum]|uniref:hypothetical protein n=1 Tax=Flavobacterium psychrotrophum TaxID=2294119 RepID=UPI000E30B670|nr:hypothetical protein [Flavobacterium psychrotrophum]
MKNLKLFGLLFFLAFLTSYASNITNDLTGGYFDVYLKNNCNKEVEVRVRADGSSSVSKYKTGEKIKVPVKAGYEVYVDGKLLLKLTDAESGKEINLCK